MIGRPSFANPKRSLIVLLKEAEFRSLKGQVLLPSADQIPLWCSNYFEGLNLFCGRAESYGSISLSLVEFLHCLGRNSSYILHDDRIAMYRTRSSLASCLIAWHISVFYWCRIVESKFNLLRGLYHLICQNEILCKPSLEYLEAQLLGYAENFGGQICWRSYSLVGPRSFLPSSRVILFVASVVTRFIILGIYNLVLRSGLNRMVEFSNHLLIWKNELQEEFPWVHSLLLKKFWIAHVICTCKRALASNIVTFPRWVEFLSKVEAYFVRPNYADLWRSECLVEIYMLEVT